jgi:hypothetical protein
MELKLKIFFVAFLTNVNSEILSRNFTMPLDHFDPTSTRNFELQYLVNEEFFRENGPVLIYINHGPASPQFIQEGNMYEIAEKEGGVLISLERRYYGKSLPTPDATFENLKWFTHDQSVADIAEFASFIKEQYFDAPVILWGREHGANLAIWARQKYPNVIDGAWASSPRINAIPEATEYIPHSIKKLREIGGTECAQVITDAFNMVEEAFQSGNTSYVEDRLFSCGPINVTNEYDMTTFTYFYAVNIPVILSRMKYSEIEGACSIMLGRNTPENLPSNAVDAFARWYVDTLLKPQSYSCIPNNFKTYMATYYQGTTWTEFATLSGRRQRVWLNCAQHGQFQVANNGQGHPFGTRFDFR